MPLPKSSAWRRLALISLVLGVAILLLLLRRMPPARQPDIVPPAPVVAASPSVPLAAPQPSPIAHPVAAPEGGADMAQLRAQIDSLRIELTNLEAKVYAADPALRSYEKLQGTPRKWREQRGLDHFIGDYIYGQEADREKREEAVRKLEEIVKKITLHELPANGYEPLFRAIMDLANDEARRQLMAETDQAAGVATNSASASNHRPATTDALLENFRARYPALREAADNLCDEYGIPHQVYEALRGDSIEGQLNVFIEAYLHKFTPAELRDMRQRLRQVEIKLENMAATHAPLAAPN